jgi:hypothetical protein
MEAMIIGLCDSGERCMMEKEVNTAHISNDLTDGCDLPMFISMFAFHYHEQSLLAPHVPRLFQFTNFYPT